MSRAYSAPPVSLYRRFQRFTRRWATNVAWGVHDAFDLFDEPAKIDRQRRVTLGVWPLEDRQMPSFGIALQAAAPDALQGTFQTIGRTTVGLLDGNASLNVPIPLSIDGSCPPSRNACRNFGLIW
jgi:hypothetical protein